MTRTAGAPMGCQRPSRFWGLGCPKIYHEAEDTLVSGFLEHLESGLIGLQVVTVKLLFPQQVDQRLEYVIQADD
ncbi:hypothetical protein, partial [Thiolapillus sp.]